jgi:putative ABC transport system permease protein
MLTLVNVYLLRSLPFPDAERLVSLSLLPPNSPHAMWQEMPWEEIEQIDWPPNDEVVQHYVTWDLDAFTLLDNEPEVLVGAWIVPSYFTVTGARAQLGRVLVESDAQSGAPAVAVIGHDLWQRRYGGNPNIVGRTVNAFSGDRPLDAEAFTIVGVLEPGFWFVNQYTEFLPALREARSAYMAQLRPGVSTERARQHFTTLVTGHVAGLPTGWQMDVASVHDRYVATVKPVLLTLFVAALLVFLLACGNVAVLLIVRSLERRRELAIRCAMGASRWRVARQLLTEGGLLAFAGSALGLAMAWVLLGAFGTTIETQLRTGVPGGLPNLRPDALIVLVTVGAGLLTGMLFAVAPMLSLPTGQLTVGVQGSARGTTDTPRRQLMRYAIIGVEVAVSFALLTGAALMVRSTLHLQQLDLGFDPAGVQTANVSMRLRSYPEQGDRVAFARRLLDEIRSAPGVSAASSQSQWMFQPTMTSTVQTDDASVDAGGSRAYTYTVSPDYFEVLGIPLLRGRDFDTRDVPESEPVAVVSQDLANRLWPGRDPIGRRIRAAGVTEQPWRTVIGVSGPTLQSLTDEELPEIFVPYAQASATFLYVVAQYTGAPGSFTAIMRSALSTIDPTIAVSRHGPMAEIVNQQTARPKFMAALLTTFSGVTVILALSGLYAVVAFAVSSRRRDIAIRMTLGARKGQIVAMVLRRGGWVIAAGLGTGGVLAAGLNRTMASQLFGVTALDAITYVATALALGVIATVAILWPARRAASIDPATALRE